MRGEVRGLPGRKVRGSRAVQPRLGAGLRGGVGVDGEAGDPLAVGQGQAGRLRVVDGLVVALVGPVLEGPATVVLVAGLGKDREAVGAHHGGLVARIAGGLGVLGGPGAGQGVFPAEVKGGVTRVGARETPWVEAAANLVLEVVAGLHDAAADLTLGEAVRNLGALGDDGRRVVHGLGGDGRLVGDRVVERDRALGVLYGDGGLDRVLPEPFVVRPRDGVCRRVVDAAVGGRDEDGLGGQRVHDLDVLDTHEAEAVQTAAVLHRGAVPADTDLVRVARIDLLIAVAQFVGRLATNGGVVRLGGGAALLDGDVGGRGPRGGQLVLDLLSVQRAEAHLLGGRRVVRRIVAVVVPGDLDTVGRAGGQRILQLEDVALHARAVRVLLGRGHRLGHAATGDGDDRVAALDELEAGGRDRAGQRQLDFRLLTGGGHRGAGEVDRRDLIVADAQSGLIVHDVQSQGRLVFRDCAGTARTGLTLGGDLGGGSLSASLCRGSLSASLCRGSLSAGLGGRRVDGLRVGRGRGSFLRGCHVGCLRAFVGGAGSHGEGCQRRDEKRESGQTGSTRNTHTGAERTQSRHRLLLLSSECGQDLRPSLVKEQSARPCLTTIA
ncbi:Uncharacterised protein [uncultured Actinomyces sp.]|nr:Uncharacterised protein [uncultured Actinomyces sp.]